MSMTEKVAIWLVAGAFIGICLFAALEALRGLDEDGFYE